MVLLNRKDLQAQALAAPARLSVCRICTNFSTFREKGSYPFPYTG